MTCFCVRFCLSDHEIRLSDHEIRLRIQSLFRMKGENFKNVREIFMFLVYKFVYVFRLSDQVYSFILIKVSSSLNQVLYKLEY